MIIEKSDNLRDSLSLAHMIPSYANMNANTNFDAHLNQRQSNDIQSKSDFADTLSISYNQRSEGVSQSQEEPMTYKKNEVKTESHFELNSEPKSEPKTEPKTESKTENKEESKTDPKADSKNQSKSNDKTQANLDTASSEVNHINKKSDKQLADAEKEQNADNQIKENSDAQIQKIKLSHKPSENTPADATAKNSKFSDIKEFIKVHQTKTEQMSNAKDEITENLSQTQKIQNDYKTVLKNLEPTKSTTSGKTSEKAEELKINTPIREEKKESEQPVEGDKKTEKSALKIEFKIKESERAETPHASTISVDPKDNTLQTTEAKLKKLLGSSSNAEQYEALKEKIMANVENSIKFLITDNERNVTIKLQPPELGKVQVDLIFKDNQVNAKITTENVAVKEVILTNLDQLKSNLESSGITVTKFDVDVGGFKNQFDQQFSNGNNGTNTGDGKKGQQGYQQALQEKDWLPDKVIMQKALNFFLGRSVNYLV